MYDCSVREMRRRGNWQGVLRSRDSKLSILRQDDFLYSSFGCKSQPVQFKALPSINL